MTRWPWAALPLRPRGDRPSAEEKRSEWPGPVRGGLQPRPHCLPHAASPAAPGPGSRLRPGKPDPGGPGAWPTARHAARPWHRPRPASPWVLPAAASVVGAGQPPWAPRPGDGQVAPAPQHGPGNHRKRKRVRPSPRPRASCPQECLRPGTGLLAGPQWPLTAGPSPRLPQRLALHPPVLWFLRPQVCGGRPLCPGCPLRCRRPGQWRWPPRSP